MKNYKMFLALSFVAFLIAGCASRRIVPVADGGMVNAELRRATKIESGVTVTVESQAWRAEPSYLDSYVTPFYVVVENNTDSSVTLGYDDLVLFDENRTQYSSLRPETVAQVLQSGYRNRYAFRPYFGSAFIGGGFHRFHHYRYYPYYYYDPFFLDFFSPIWYYPPAPEDFDDVLTKAFIPGVIRPNAKLQGFVYFKRIPPEAQGLTLEVAYKLEGEQEPHKLSFPFSIETRR